MENSHKILLTAVVLSLVGFSALVGFMVGNNFGDKNEAVVIQTQPIQTTPKQATIEVVKTDCEDNLSTTTPKVSIEYKDNAGDYYAQVSQDGLVVKKIDLNDDENMKANEYWKPLSLYKQTARYAYIRHNPNGVGDMTGFATFMSKIERLDLQTGKIDTITLPNKNENGGIQLESISDSEDLYLWRYVYGVAKGVLPKHKLLVHNVLTDQVKEFDLPTSDTYITYGDSHFSPGNQKVAFASLKLNEQPMQGSVYILDLSSGKITEFQKSSKTHCSFQVYGWYDENSPAFEPIQCY